MSVGLILLAAGASVRLGQPKQLLSFHGKTLLRRACETARAAGFSPLTVVLADREFAAEIDDLPFVLNPDWREGLGTSIRAGLRAIRPKVTGVVVMLCDQPLITAEFLQRLAATNSPLAAAEYGGSLGVPAYFSEKYFDELETVTGGAKEILLRHRREVTALPCPEAAIDIDTQMDFAKLTLSEYQKSSEPD